MCLLVVCDALSTPSREELKLGACRNPDGFGFAIMTPDGIVSERDMNADRSIDRFLELRALYPAGYAMWHCRIATHGGITIDNCHPFPMGNDGLTYLAHNGMLSLPLPVDYEGSDTRFFTDVVLPSMGGVEALDDPYRWHILEKWSTGSKIAIITIDPRAKFNLYILNEKAGDWDTDGVWWSNTYHRPAPARTYSGYGHKDYSWSEDKVWDYEQKCYVPKDKAVAIPEAKPRSYDPYDEDYYDESLFSDSVDDPADIILDFACMVCRTYLTLADSYDGTCNNCNACLDCGEHLGYCLCWESPKSKAIELPSALEGAIKQPTNAIRKG